MSETNSVETNRVERIVMCAHIETRQEKLNFVYKQTQQVVNHKFVRCFCEVKLKLHIAYKCLYCGEWYCQKCAETHFGQTRQDYLKEQAESGSDPMLHENY